MFSKSNELQSTLVKADQINRKSLNKFISYCDTPSYIYDLGKLKRNYEQFATLFNEFKIFYSVKTNPNIEILKELDALSSNFDAASIGEISQLVQLGINPSKILYTHPIKFVKDIQKAYSLGIINFTFDSLKELTLLIENAPKAAYFMRVKPPTDGDFYPYSDKFGVSEDSVSEMINFCMDRRLLLKGLSFHVGSQNMSLKPWEDVLKIIVNLYNEYSSKGYAIPVLNIGSGFPFEYSFKACPTLKEIRNKIKSYTDRLPLGTELWCEPGRVLVANTVMLICSVIRRLERCNSNWLFVDMGVYHGLIEILESRGRLEYEIDVLGRTGETSKFNIAGWTLDPDDNLALNISLPKGVQDNDRLIIKGVGAYTYTLYSNYHSFLPPNIYYLC
ncbi:MAG: hypothetical protein AAB443_04065 [Patescibacteria group bacterium]